MIIKRWNGSSFLIFLISIAFILWGGAFIYKSSFITIDNNRSFSLFDDAMISMRYAWNFSHGNGLVWNPGERVQGYTNLLMTLLMSFATLIFSKSIAVLFIQITGIVFMLIIAALTMQIAGEIFYKEHSEFHTLLRILSFLCGLTYYPLAYWSLMGMETGMLTMFLLGGVLMAIKYVRSKDQKLLWISAMSFGLAFLTRNDSVIFAILVWIYFLWATFEPDKNNGRLLQLAAPSGFYLLVVIGQLMFQYFYYGQMLPNTYLLKLTGMPFALRIQGGLGFVFLFLKETAFILTLATIGMVIHFRKEKFLLFSFILTALSYQAYVGGDPWNYWRMMAPVIPLVIILAMDALITIANGLTRRNSFRSGLAPHRAAIRNSFVAASILTGMLITNWRFLPEALFQVNPYQSIRNLENVNIAIVLNEILRSDATVGVFWAGSIPYYTDKKTVDFLGKSDPYIAHLPPDISGSISWWGMQSVPGHNKYDLNYSIVSLKPTYVQGFIYGSQDLSQWAAENYVKIIHRRIPLFLLTDAGGILWSRKNIR